MNLVYIKTALLAIALASAGLETAQAVPRALCDSNDSPSTPAVTTATPTVTPEATTVAPVTPAPTTATPTPTTAAPETPAPTTVTPAPTTVTPAPTTVTPAPTTAQPTVTPAPTTAAELYCPTTSPSYTQCIAALAKSSPIQRDTVFSASLSAGYVFDGLALWQCINKCADQIGCLAYTSRASSCSLYVHTGETVTVTNALTATILAPKSSCTLSLNTEFVGEVLAEAPGASYETCCARCEMEEDCSTFTFTPDSICMLYALIDGKHSLQYYTSGVWSVSP